LKFSRPFIAQIEDMKRENYKLKSARVNFIIYWIKEGAAQEIRIFLPELFFERRNSQ
jgi:ATP-dependent DNA helicase RecQ